MGRCSAFSFPGSRGEGCMLERLPCVEVTDNPLDEYWPCVDDE